jgi:2-desacetyl-2-hydroxyethyl bacteriochlorophyllide A dehydrogenase
MKAAVLTGPEKIEIKELQPLQIKPGEVLVKLKNCGICTLEQRLYSGAMKIFYPIILGHEAAGEIVEVGSEVLSDFKPGTRVALDLITRCGECYYCRTGHSNMCANRFKKGVQVLGGFGEYIAVKPKQVFPISSAVNYQEAAFAEPIACCIHSLRKIQLQLAEDVLILGAGVMGMLHLQVANCMGARVFVSDPDNNRLKTAGELGAFQVINPLNDDIEEIIKTHTEGRGVDVCIVTTQSMEALKSVFSLISKSGRVNIYTSYSDKPEVPVDANTIHRDELLVTGSEGRTEFDFQQAVRLLGFGKIDVKKLISSVHPFGDIENGMKSALGNHTFRVLLEHEGK